MLINPLGIMLHPYRARGRCSLRSRIGELLDQVQCSSQTYRHAPASYDFLDLQIPPEMPGRNQPAASAIVNLSMTNVYAVGDGQLNGKD